MARTIWKTKGIRLYVDPMQ